MFYFDDQNKSKNPQKKIKKEKNNRKNKKTMYIYGIINKDNCLIDISKSEKGTKRYATLNGYNKVGCRNVNSYNASIIAEKVGNRWQSVEG